MINPTPDYPSIQYPKPYDQMEVIREEVEEHEHMRFSDDGNPNHTE